MPSLYSISINSVWHIWETIDLFIDKYWTEILVFDKIKWCFKLSKNKLDINKINRFFLKK